jgi:hypothetical protein
MKNRYKFNKYDIKKRNNNMMKEEDIKLVLESQYSSTVDKLRGQTSVLEHFRFLLLRDYLFRIYINNQLDDRIDLHACWGIKEIANKILDKVVPDSTSNLGCLNFSERAVYFYLSFNKIRYMITTTFVNVEVTSIESILYIVSIVCLDDKAEPKNQELLDYLLLAATSSSTLKNKIIFIKDKEFKDKFWECTEIISPKSIMLDDIFLPNYIAVQIKRFIAEVKNYGSENDKINKQFRYLLSGLPGTGKSQIINAIMNAVYEKITIVVVNGIDFKMAEIINFCKIFDPCLLVIDDMDFIARKRDENFNSNSLINFLHALDGLLPESLFLLGATNDKFLVDEAACRPGRFDMILDISKISEDNYLDLIKRETNDESLIELFNDEILSFMEAKKVTGAFIVNLIKQLTSVKKMEGKAAVEDLQSLLKFTYEGFYLDPVKLGNVIGFK